MKDIKISPSIFAADFTRIGEAIKIMEEYGVFSIHFDIMDFHFVPNLSFGPDFIKDVQKHTKLKEDVHLMIELSEEKLRRFIELKPFLITLHVESPGFSYELLERIKCEGIKVGLALKPKTPLEKIKEYLDILDLILVMTVEPGFYGQEFLESSLEKIRECRGLIDSYKESRGREIWLQVDGGINANNIMKVIEAGADYIVIGSGFFRNDGYKKLKTILHNLARF